MPVYLLHFDEPISPDHITQHYLGYTDNLTSRILQHQNGRGSRLCAVAKERGIDFVVARTWLIEGDRALERKLKNQKTARDSALFANLSGKDMAQHEALVLSPLAPDQIYPTSQVATLLGVSEGTIRSRKSRGADQLKETVHWINQEGSTFWTSAGVLELAKTTQSEQAQALLAQAGSIVPAPPATPSVAADATGTVAEPATQGAEATPNDATPCVAIDLSFLEPLLDATGQGMALEFYRRLPNYVLKHVERMAKNPTPQEREVIQAAFQPLQRMQQEVSDQCAS